MAEQIPGRRVGDRGHPLQIAARNHLEQLRGGIEHGLALQPLRLRGVGAGRKLQAIDITRPGRAARSGQNEHEQRSRDYAAEQKTLAHKRPPHIMQQIWPICAKQKCLSTKARRPVAGFTPLWPHPLNGGRPPPGGKCGQIYAYWAKTQAGLSLGPGEILAERKARNHFRFPLKGTLEEDMYPAQDDKPPRGLIF